MSKTHKFWVKVCQSGVVILTGLSWFSGCESASGDLANVGDECESSSGRTGTIVEDSGKCLVDDAFCEAQENGTYCTGTMPFSCPPGETRPNWERKCVPTDGSGGQGGEGSGGRGSGGQSSVGNTCKSSSGRSGTVVASDSGCLLDDAFCEARADGTYCTGSMPFICPEGQVRIDWLRCGPDPDLPSGGGAGGEGGAH